jgi:vacuolar-type H+-ATPase subunit H
MPNESRADRVIDAAEDSVKAALEAAQRIARESLDAGTEVARRVQDSIKDALEAITDGGDRDSDGAEPPSRRT